MSAPCTKSVIAAVSVGLSRLLALRAVNWNSPGGTSRSFQLPSAAIVVPPMPMNDPPPGPTIS